MSNHAVARQVVVALASLFSSRCRLAVISVCSQLVQRSAPSRLPVLSWLVPCSGNHGVAGERRTSFGALGKDGGTSVCRSRRRMFKSGNVCCPGMWMRLGYEGVQYQRKGGQFVELAFLEWKRRESRPVFDPSAGRAMATPQRHLAGVLPQSQSACCHSQRDLGPD